MPASPFRADKNLAYSMHISLLRIIPASILDIADEMCRGRLGGGRDAFGMPWDHAYYGVMCVGGYYNYN